MDLNRNQFFFLGIMVLLLGLQVRMVSTYVLTSDATRFLAEKSGQTTPTQTALTSLADRSQALPGKVLEPPEWLGWCLISLGAVFVLHSLAMPRPG